MMKGPFILFVMVAAFMVGTITYFSNCYKVPAGNVGVKVYLLGSNKGVDAEELGTGRYWIGWNEDLFLFPTFTQNYTWSKDNSKGDESITFQTSEGMTVDADVGISYHIERDKVTGIFQKYRKGIDEITDIYLRNMVRDAIVTETSDKTVEYVYGNGKAELMKKVEARVRGEVNELGIIVEKIYWIGTVRLPQPVIDSLNLKIQATQKAEQRNNEVAQSKAEAAKKVAEAQGQADSLLLVAKAQADANKILAQSLTPELVNYKAIEKWSGDLPRFTGSGVIPFLNVEGAAASK